MTMTTNTYAYPAHNVPVTNILEEIAGELADLDDRDLAALADAASAAAEAMLAIANSDDTSVVTGRIIEREVERQDGLHDAIMHLLEDRFAVAERLDNFETAEFLALRLIKFYMKIEFLGKLAAIAGRIAEMEKSRLASNRSKVA